MAIGPGYALVGWRLDGRKSEILRDPLRSRVVGRSKLEFSLLLWVDILDTEERRLGGGGCAVVDCYGGSKSLFEDVDDRSV